MNLPNFVIDIPTAIIGIHFLLFIFYINEKKVPEIKKQHTYRICGSRKEDAHNYVVHRERRTPWEIGKRDWRKDDCGCYTWDNCPARQRRV